MVDCCTMEDLVKKQKRIGDLIRNFNANTLKVGKQNITKGYLEARQALLITYWGKFDNTHQLIEDIEVDEEDEANDYFINDVYGEIERIYSMTHGAINDELAAFVRPAAANSTALAANVNANAPAPAAAAAPQHLKIPALSLPTFSGDYRAWTSFYDRFSSLVVNNPTLSDVNKLHHLKSSLSGDAALVLNQFTVEAANFDPAWTLLQRRYANKRMLINAHLCNLFAQPKVHNDSDAIRRLFDNSVESVTALKKLLADDDGKLFDTILIYMLSQRMDGKSIEVWEQSRSAQEAFPTFDEFTTFFENHCRTRDLVQYAIHPTTSKAERVKSTKSFHVTNTRVPCVYCNKDSHATYTCFQFKRQPVRDRVEFVQIKGLCTTCLSSEHKAPGCPHQFKCFKCKGNHHSLLHINTTSDRENTRSSTNPSTSTHTVQIAAAPSSLSIAAAPPSSQIAAASSSSQSTSSTVFTHHTTNQGETQTLLATVQVFIKAANGKMLRMRALVDPGSQATIIARAAADLLKIKPNKSQYHVKGIGATSAGVSSHSITSRIVSIHDSTIFIDIEAIVMPKLTSLLPSTQVMVKSWPHILNLPLADPSFHTPGKIDIVLGADIYGNLMLPDIRKGPPGTPIAQRTTLGWLLLGKTTTTTEPHATRITSDVISCFSEVSVCEQLQRFWEIEELPQSSPPTQQEIISEAHYIATHRRKSDGRYVVELPFNTPNNVPPLFSDTKFQAYKRFNYMEKRLNANADLKAQYDAFMHEYLRLGHMHKVPSASTAIAAFYLPHHAIIKPGSLTTKLRVVFDASARDTNGMSLNESLCVGPTIQQDILSIMLRWRRHKIALTGDLEKMYRQIEVNPIHQPFQRILWRDELDNVAEFELSTVTYGTACAPYLAIRTVQQLAQDERDNFPNACDKIITDMYVDDFISGCSTVIDAQKLQRDLVHVFKRGGFNLRKWASNSTEVLDNIPVDSREKSACLDVCRDDVIKTLGLFWRTTDDVFKFMVTLADVSPIYTKRGLLSDISKIFDPVDYLAPVIIVAKILFQSLWLTGISWDDALPENIKRQWSTLRSQLYAVEAIEIPRWIGTAPENTRMEFHGFCDASIKAYAAVVYCRIEMNGVYHVNLLTSKTRVAPIKKITLPNLELCGAALLATLLSKVQASMQLDATIYAWTDSTIVLDWLRSNTHKQTFVANRISQILNHLKPHEWRHVRSKDNPADVASRGICPTLLQQHDLWWRGPHWLQQSEDHWPHFVKKEEHRDPEDADNIETQVFVAVLDEYLSSVIEKFSSFSDLLRVITCCRRFARLCCKKPAINHTTVNEYRESLHILLNYVQLMYYSSEIKLLQHSSPLHNSKIAALYPFIDKNNLLRVGGRLRNANIDDDQKHPILLPKEHHLTRILVQKIHVDTLHGGMKMTLAKLRQRYWVPNSRTLIRMVIHNCTVCVRQAALCRQQLMAALPAVRVTPAKVFSHTGIDYAGPFNLRLSKCRGRGTYKGYVAVFVCMATKAIHLELASDLSSSTFIAAFKRFVARRGPCSDVYSDNGTNFVGANKELRASFDAQLKEMEKASVSTLALQGTEWHFIPGHAPHFGGLWEAAVKSFKHHLRRIVDQSVLTYEEFYTLLAEIEANLNSRPLCQLSSDPNDLDALTPGHFIMGCPPNAVPEPSLLSVNDNRLSRWKLLVKMNQDFWATWSSDYLNELQQRPKKWRSQRENLSEGDIVIVKDDLLPPAQWRLARIVQTHPGADGLVRVATIQHKTGITKRPVNKLIKLPTSETYPKSNQSTKTC